MNRRNAFTLVEMLVVVAIITALIAMLMPAMSRAREIARRAACCSQMHQLYLKNADYAADNFGTYLDTRYQPGTPGRDHITWLYYTTYLYLAYGGNYTSAVNTNQTLVEVPKGEENLYCPNRLDEWRVRAKGPMPTLIRTGYWFQFGKAGWVSPDGVPWTSPTSTRDTLPSQEMITDISEKGTIVTGGMLGTAHASHGYNGRVIIFEKIPVGNGSDWYYHRKGAAPRVIDGTDVTYGDGSVSWRGGWDMHWKACQTDNLNPGGWW